MPKRVVADALDSRCASNARVPIFRQLAVTVDGGRADLASPTGYVESMNPQSGWKIDRSEYEFVRQFSVIRGRAEEFDRYFEQAERGADFKIV